MGKRLCSETSGTIEYYEDRKLDKFFIIYFDKIVYFHQGFQPKRIDIIKWLGPKSAQFIS